MSEINKIHSKQTTDVSKKYEYTTYYQDNYQRMSSFKLSHYFLSYQIIVKLDVVYFITRTLFIKYVFTECINLLLYLKFCLKYRDITTKRANIVGWYKNNNKTWPKCCLYLHNYLCTYVHLHYIVYFSSDNVAHWIKNLGICVVMY